MCIRDSSRTVGNVLPVLITMGSLLIVSYIMQSPTTGMMNLLASDIAAVVGRDVYKRQGMDPAGR